MQVFPSFLEEFSEVGLIVCEEEMTIPPCLIGSLQLICNEFFLITFQLFFLLRVSARYNFSKIIPALFLNVSGVWTLCLTAPGKRKRELFSQSL